jgi:hypothetical protein
MRFSVKTCWDDEDEEFIVTILNFPPCTGGQSTKIPTTNSPVKLADLLPVFGTKYLPIRKH